MDKVSLQFNKQCPQYYIYLGSALLGALVLLKVNKYNLFINQLIGVALMALLLLGMGFCYWPWQWITWVIAGFSIISGLVYIVLLLMPSKNVKAMLEPDTYEDNTEVYEETQL